MKIIVVISKLGKGGGERVLSVLSQEWIKKNDVKLIIFDKTNLSYSFSGEIINLNLPALNGIFFKIFQFFRRSIKLLKLFRQENPDLIISFMESANFPCICGAHFSSKLKKLIISVHSDPKTMLRIQSFSIPYLYRFPKQIISVSKGVANSLIRIGIPKKNIKIIFNPLANSAPNINQILAKPKKAPKNYILAVGRLDKQKGFDLLIEAFENLPTKNIHLVILGDGKEKKNLEEISIKKRLSDRIHLFGLVDDIWPWYRHAKCFVSSSLSEAWGNVIVEAMSQGCPVIAFDCDYGPREIIKNRFNGILVKVKNTKSLTKAIINLLSDKQLRNKLVRNALVRSSEFDPKILSNQWLK